MGIHGEHRVVVSAGQATGTIAIVGGGPAGLMAAEILADAGHRVTVYDRMPSVARKFLMAGRGGLNLTHSEPLPDFLARYAHAGPDRIRPAVSAYPPDAVVAWAHGLGEETFEGSSGRVFPKCFKASPLLRAWLRRLDALGVEFKTRHSWLGWDDDGQPIIEDASGTRVAITPHATLLALGGASWPRLGSDGSWVGPFAESNIPVTPLSPSNCGVLVSWSEIFRTRCEGQVLKRIAASFAGRSVRGEAVITRRGMEGSPVYALSRALREATSAGGTAVMMVDLKPDTPLDLLAGRLAAPQGKQSFSNYLRKVLSVDPVAIALLRESYREPPRKSYALAAALKNVSITVTGVAGLERAISSAGGVALAAVDNAFMLAARPGTFVAGEMLDWEAPTGGYLLQATLATSVAAARGILAWLEHASAKRIKENEARCARG